MTPLRVTDQTAPAILTPTLTAYDRRVLDTLPEADRHGPWTGLSAWQAAELLRTDDVTETRRILEGLCRFGYAIHGRSKSRRGLMVYGRCERLWGTA